MGFAREAQQVASSGVLVGEVRIVDLTHRNAVIVDGDCASKALRIEQVDPGWSNDDVIDVAPSWNVSDRLCKGSVPLKGRRWTSWQMKNAAVLRSLLN